MRFLKPVNSVAWHGALFLLALFCVPSCARNSRQQQYLARVDNAQLTQDQVLAAVDTSLHGEQAIRAYVDDWIVTELLYQEAARRGLTETDDIRRQVDDTRRHLAIAALMDRELYAASDTVSLPDGALRAYLDSAGTNLTLQSDVLLASYALFAERDAANTFRSRLLGGTSWSTALDEAQRDSALSSQLRRVVTRQYCTPQTLYPQELWKLARTLGTNEVSFALKTAAGYYIIQVYSIKHQGETPDLDYARPEIRERLLLEQRRSRYGKLLENLRARHFVDVRLPASSDK
jgi:hypothetical protein